MLVRLFLALWVLALFLVGSVWWHGWMSRIDRAETCVDGQPVTIELHCQRGGYYLRTMSHPGSYTLLRVADVREFPAEPMLTLSREGRDLSVNAGGRHVRFVVRASGLMPKSEAR